MPCFGRQLAYLALLKVLYNVVVEHFFQLSVGLGLGESLGHQDGRQPFCRPLQYTITRLTVKVWSINVVCTIITIQNHSKCEWNSYFRWFCLVKQPRQQRYMCKKGEKPTTMIEPIFSNNQVLEWSEIKLWLLYCMTHILLQCRVLLIC